MTSAQDNTLVSAIDDGVDVEYSQFCLQDMARMHSALSSEVPSGSDWLVVGGPGGALFHSARNDHAPAVRLELWTSRPTPPAEPWDATAEDTFTTDGTELRLWSVTAAMGQHTLVLPAPGTYHLRAYVWGQAAIAEADDADFAVGLERWLLQIWPSQA